MTEHHAFERALTAMSAAPSIRRWNAAFKRALAEFDRLTAPNDEAGIRPASPHQPPKPQST